MPRQDVPGGNLRTLAAFLFVILPALIFYAVLIRLSYNLPLMDDYHALLNPVDGLLQVSGTRSKIAYFFAAQHNEYKLWLDIAVAWAQVKLFGRMNFQALCLVGDSFVLGLGLVLWRLFPLRQNNLATRLMWFAPASWLLFQLSYAETLNWAMAGLQNLPVVLFSFIALMLLMDVRWVCFAGAVACLVLAVASSGNGFLLLVVGGLALIMQRRYAHLAS